MNAQLFAAILLATLFAFSAWVLRSIYQANPTPKVVVAVGAAFTLWLTTAYLLLVQGALDALGNPVLAFAGTMSIPLLVGVVAYRSSSQIRSTIASMTTTDFLRIQLWRSPFGVLFFFADELPLWFQLVGGLGDIAAGLGAAAALRYLQNNPEDERRAIIVGNAIGVLDFMVVFTAGLGFVVPGVALDFSFNLIPFYGVPIFSFTHAASIVRLRPHHTTALAQT